ncbi:RHS repeat-associated core domain-containing protein [Ruminococcus bromii]|uniref:RHS repeat-associated core domain-containing protein n=2 Tax=Ruminococcus bromii TaxID=40518 RepID=A0ABT0NK99_9FIRM|nr:RHS repeat-associated core domain-containing protein [Ruminococcus bromii]
MTSILYNLFRYRSYYYDSESGLYYLMSRYYDPVVHRFLNADGYFQSGDNILDTNMNAYCQNNPIMNSDPTGESCRKHACYYVGSCEAVILICKIEKKQTGICSKCLFGGFKKGW